MKSKLSFDRKSYEPAYIQIVNIIRQQIADGVYPPGAKLPSEAQLRKQFGVSPMTIRRAINVLLDQGVVDTTQGKGTFVKLLDLGDTSFHLKKIQEIFADREHSEVKILSTRILRADSLVAKQLSIPEGDRVVFIRRLINNNDRTLFYHQQYLLYDPTLPIVEAEMDLTSLEGLFKGSGNSYLKKGIVSLNAISFDEEDARYLGGKAGTPGFVLEHTFYDLQNQKVSWGWLKFRGDSLKFTARVGIWETLEE